MTIEIPLWSYQQAAVQTLLNNRRNYGALFMGVGTGKTRTTLSFIFNHTNFKRVLVLVSKKGVMAWEEEIAKLGITVPYHDLTEGKAAYRALNLRTITAEDEFIVVANYEALTMTPFWNSLSKINFDIVVADEAQRIGGHGSIRSQRAAKIKTRYKLALSGTPFQDRPLDVFGIARFLCPSYDVQGKMHSYHFGSWTRFKYEYAVWRGEHDVVLVGYKDVKSIGDILSDFSYIVDRHAVLDLPEEHHVIKHVLLNNEAQRAYDALEKDFVFKTQEGEMVTTDRKITQVLRLQQLTNGVLRLDSGVPQLISNDKALLLADTLEEIGNEPVVVFHRFVNDITSIKETVDSSRKVYLINGALNQLKDWRKDPSGVLVVQMQSGSEAIDLTHSRYIIYYSMDWSMGRYMQSIGRISRPTQKAETVYYIHLLAKGTIDDDIYQAVLDKRDVVDGIIERMLLRYKGGVEQW